MSNSPKLILRKKVSNVEQLLELVEDVQNETDAGTLLSVIYLSAPLTFDLVEETLTDGSTVLNLTSIK